MATLGAADISASTRAIASAIDEARHPDGSPRAHWRAVLEALDGVDLTALAKQADAYAMRAEVRFGEGANAAAFRLDPVPRVIAAVEWDLLAAGLEQRARALDAFLVDMYAEQRIVDAGVIPPWITDAPMVEPDLLGFPHATRLASPGSTSSVAPTGSCSSSRTTCARHPAPRIVAARSIVHSLLPWRAGRVSGARRRARRAPAREPRCRAATGEPRRRDRAAVRRPPQQCLVGAPRAGQDA